MKPIPKIKICCISSLDEAMAAINAGADVLGLVGHMPSGPGIISDDLAAEIVSQVPQHIETFLLTSETSAEGIITHHNKVNSTALQIVDELAQGSYAEIKVALPDTQLVQVIHVIDQKSIDQAKAVSSHVDAILLDSGNPNLAVKELGGTGRTHNWHLSQAITAAVKVPVFLAGGLNSNNVNTAISQVKPFGLDLCSSVRTDDKLDLKKLAKFIQAAQK